VNAQEIHSLIQQHLGAQPGFDANTSQEFANHLAAAVSATGTASKGAGAPGKADCYKKCQDARNAAGVACAKLGWPAGMLCVGQAVLAFNACRHKCDQG
jgi:hypothetical protein